MIISSWNPVLREIAAVSNSNPAVVTTTDPHNYLDGLIVRLYLTGSPMPVRIQDTFVITLIDQTSFSIPLDTTNFPIFLPPETNQISSITNANPMVVTVGAHNFFVGQSVIIEDVVGVTLDIDGFFTYVNGKIMPIIAISPTTISFNLDTSDYSAYASGGSVSTIYTPQVIPVGEVSGTLLMAEKNVS